MKKGRVWPGTQTQWNANLEPLWHQWLNKKGAVFWYPFKSNVLSRAQFWVHFPAPFFSHVCRFPLFCCKPHEGKYNAATGSFFGTDMLPGGQKNCAHDSGRIRHPLVAWRCVEYHCMQQQIERWQTTSDQRFSPTSMRLRKSECHHLR